MAQAFISYSRKDRDFVQKLVDRLTAEKREVWLDDKDIEPTAEWLKEIFKNIEAADNFLFVISPNSVVSTYARKEIDHAVLNNKRIVPIFHQPVPDKDIPEAVAKLQRIDFTGVDGFDAKFAKLIAALDTDLNWKQAHTRLLTRAREWEREGKDSSFLLRGRDLREAEQWVAKSDEKGPNPTTLHSQYILVSRQSATSTQRMIIGAVAVAALVAAGLARYAFVQKNRAQRETNAADANALEAQKQQKAAQDNAAEAQKQQKAADASAEDARQQKDVAVKNEKEAERQKGIAQANEAKANYGRIVNTWQSAARTASRDVVSHDDDDRSALLARQAMLIHALTPSEPRYLVEQALQDAAAAMFFVHVFPLQKAVEAVAFSPDSNRLAAADGDEIRVWDLRHPTSPPLVLSNLIATSSISFSPDGTLLVLGGEYDNVRVWSLLQPDTPPVVLPGPKERVNSVVFAPDGNRVASGSDAGAARIWDLRLPHASPQVLSHPGKVASVAFAPDGHYLATACWADGKVRLWDTQNGGAPSELSVRRGGVLAAVIFAPDGKRLVATDLDKIVVWYLDRLEEPPEVRFGHEGVVASLSFAAGSRYLASAGWDKTVRIWDLWNQSSHPLVLKGHSQRISSVAFAPSGKRLASGGDDRTVRVWDLRDPDASSQLLSGHENGWVTALAFSSDGKHLASSGWDKTVRVWDLRRLTAAPIVFSGHEDLVESVAFAPDGDHVASASKDKSVRLWDLRDPSASPLVLSGHQGEVFSVAFAPDGKRLVSGSADAARVWDLRQPQAPPQVFSGWIHSATFTPDGSSILAADDDVVREWSLQRPSAPSLEFLGHRQPINALAVSGNRVASASQDESVRLWDLRRPDLPSLVFGHQGQVSAVAFSPDGSRMACANNNSVRIWDLRQPSASPVVLSENGGYGFRDAFDPVPVSEIVGVLDAVAFAPEGDLLAWAGVHNTVRLWPLWSRTADYLCSIVWHNLSLEEWRLYFGKDIPYECTCPNLPPGDGASSGRNCAK
jgi:WD40 repeat protein